MSGLADAAAGLAGRLGPAHVGALGDAYCDAPDFSQAAAARAKHAVPAPHYEEVDRLNEAWSKEPDVPGSSIALALQAARAARRDADFPRVQVVVTGPDSPVAPVRLTSEVVRQLIGNATKRVTLISYAAYRLPSVIAALEVVAARGVRVSLILESPEKLEGGGGANAYARFESYHWPIERREPPDAKLHAKAVIVDGRDVLLTSANMTTAAYDRNIELGVLCRGGGVAAQVQRHFDALISAGVLERAR